MSMREPDFQGELTLLTLIHAANPNQVAELTAIATALAGDATAHDTTIQTAPAGLIPGASTSRFTNDVNLLVNIAKGGNLPTASIIAGIDAVAGLPIKPGVIDTPAVYGPNTLGSVLNCTTGNWIGTPSSYAYAWKRDGLVAIGTNAATYTLIAADIGGHAITCIVTATNAQGSTAAPPSNAIAT